MNALQFLSEVRTELGKVNWPGRDEVVKMTIMVILVSIAVGLYIGIVDITLAKILETVVK